MHEEERQRLAEEEITAEEELHHVHEVVNAHNCTACNRPFHVGDRCVEAEGNDYHTWCLTCAMCEGSLEHGYVTLNGKRYCPDCDLHLQNEEHSEKMKIWRAKKRKKTKKEKAIVVIDDSPLAATHKSRSLAGLVHSLSALLHNGKQIADRKVSPQVEGKREADPLVPEDKHIGQMTHSERGVALAQKKQREADLRAAELLIHKNTQNSDNSPALDQPALSPEEHQTNDELDHFVAMRTSLQQ